MAVVGHKSNVENIHISGLDVQDLDTNQEFSIGFPYQFSLIIGENGVGKTRLLNDIYAYTQEGKAGIPCAFVDDVVRYNGKKEVDIKVSEYALNGLGIIYGNNIEGISLAMKTREDDDVYAPDRIKVQTRNDDYPLPLMSIGHGAIQIYKVILGLSSIDNGVLLVDNLEQSIHHLRMEDLWRYIIKIAVERNIQIIAATHSWDVIRAFSQASEFNQVEAGANRIESNEGVVKVVDYTSFNFQMAVRHGIEMR